MGQLTHSSTEDCVDGVPLAEQREKNQQDKLLADSTRTASPMRVGEKAVVPASAQSSNTADSDGMGSGNITTGKREQGINHHGGASRGCRGTVWYFR